MPRPAHRHRHVRPVLVQRRLAARKRHAVIARRHDERVLPSPRFFQRRQDPRDFLVELLNLVQIRRHIRSHLRHIRQHRRHRHLARIHPRRDPRPRHVRPMRMMRSEPKTKRLIRRQLREKRVEILELPARRIHRPPARMKIPRRPALAGEADEVSIIPQQIRIRPELPRQRAPQIRPLLQLPNRPPREQRPPRRRTRCRHAMRLLENHALPRDPIQRRRRNGRIAHVPRVPPRLIIRNQEQHIRPRREHPPRTQRRDQPNPNQQPIQNSHPP